VTASESSPGEENARGSNSFPLKGYAENSRLLIDTFRQLGELGIDALVSLPKIAVIGNVRSGKSSLIEALCGVQLPQLPDGASVQTRCPIEIVLRTSERQGWAAKVLLESSGGKTFVFELVTNQKDLSQVLWRAQLAILNPSQSPETFGQLSESECADYRSELIVSIMSRVVLEITGAEVDVTLIDLPGLRRPVPLHLPSSNFLIFVDP
jgi:GTPase SAR1 family protein